MTQDILNSWREIFFAYDIKMGNPNGDPDENRPRVLPDGTHYVTDVRLKRFIRDQFKSQGENILVDTVEGQTTNLTGRVAHFLTGLEKTEANGEELVNIILDNFIDARLFGSSLAFKEDKKWKAKPVPKTLTGALQFNHGEVMNHAEPVDIHGTATFGSDEGKSQGTFTTYFALRYALIGFNGIANEHSAHLSRMTNGDYDEVLKATWKGVRNAGNTRSKVGQIPRILISLTYKPGVEFQFGNLSDYIRLVPKNGKAENAWSSPLDYQVDMELLLGRLDQFTHKIDTISYALSPDMDMAQELPGDWINLNID